MFDPPIEFAYRTTVEERRTGRVGRFLAWLGEHPILGGLGCGLIVVAIAGLRAPQGVAAEPMTAAIISILVIGTWTVLFYLMRRFFDDQSYTQRSVLRQLIVTDEVAQWLQDKKPLVEIPNPRRRILTNPVPEGMGLEEEDSKKDPTAWPVWIVLESRDKDGGESGEERLVFETRDSARRARDYDAVTPEIMDATNERLPRALTAPLLHAQ